MVYIYNSIDSIVINENKTDYIFQDFLQSQMPSKLSSSRLNLKVRASIILLYNLYPTAREYNGTRIIII